MLEYPLSLTGDEVAQILMSLKGFDPKSIAIFKIDSTELKPVDINYYVENGFYAIDYTENGPTDIGTVVPILLHVFTKKNPYGADVQYQSISVLEKICYRSTSNGGKTWTNWITSEGKSYESEINLLQLQIDAINEKIKNGVVASGLSITSFSSNSQYNDIGSSLESFVLNWSISGNPTAITLNGVTIDSSSRSKTITETLTSDASYILSVKDVDNNTDTSTLKIQFINSIFYGVSSLDSIETSDAINTLTKKRQSTKSTTITVNAGEDEYIYYACPVSYGTPTFTINGFEGGLSLIGIVNYVNAYNHSESYNVYRSTNPSLGNTTIKVS